MVRSEYSFSRTPPKFLSSSSALAQEPSILTVTHSLVKSAGAGVWVEPGSRLDWAVGNLSNDPLFVTGPLDDFYLNLNSPAVDSGSDYASVVGLIGYTTRTDELPDEGIIDMGYHRAQWEHAGRLGANFKHLCSGEFVWEVLLNQYPSHTPLLGFLADLLSTFKR